MGCCLGWITVPPGGQARLHLSLPLGIHPLLLLLKELRLRRRQLLLQLAIHHAAGLARQLLQVLHGNDGEGS